MLCDPDDPYGDRVFLENWRLELLAAHTPLSELVLAHRLNEYLDDRIDPDTEAALVGRLETATARLQQAQQLVEATWSEPTQNDRITAAFAALTEQGFFTAENLGLTIQDGWAYVGMHAPEPGRRVVFTHQQDTYDAIKGASMPLAFGIAADPKPSTSDLVVIGEEIVQVLSRFGVATSWTGQPDDRIEVQPFEWRRRRFTPWPEVPIGKPAAHQRSAAPVSLFADPEPSVLETYVQPVRAYATTDAFDSELAEMMRWAWTERLQGRRGQVAHKGDPHAFIRAGELAEMQPCNALRNLPPAVSAALWAGGAATVHNRAQGGPAAGDGGSADDAEKRPWWKVW